MNVEVGVAVDALNGVDKGCEGCEEDKTGVLDDCKDDRGECCDDAEEVVCESGAKPRELAVNTTFNKLSI